MIIWLLYQDYAEHIWLISYNRQIIFLEVYFALPMLVFVSTLLWYNPNSGYG